jgi:hypothetical protein
VLARRLAGGAIFFFNLEKNAKQLQVRLFVRTD